MKLHRCDFCQRVSDGRVTVSSNMLQMSASQLIRERILTHEPFFPGELARDCNVTQPAVHHVINDLTQYRSADFEKVQVGRQKRYRLRTEDETRKRRALAEEQHQRRELKAIHALVRRAMKSSLAPILASVGSSPPG